MSEPTFAILNGHIYCSIKIDDTYLPAGMPNTIPYIEVLENSALGAPMMKMVIHDVKNALRDIVNITDENKFTVSLSRTQDDKFKEETFRMFSHRASTAESGYSMTLYGLIDSPFYTKGVEVRSYKDVSSAVLKTVLGKGGIQPGSDDKFEDTDDKQVWVTPGNSTIGFVNSLVAHSYKDTDALMRLSVRADKTATFIDVIAALNKTAKFTLSYGDPKSLKADYTIRDLDTRTSSGFLGAWISNGYNVHEPRLDGKVYKSAGISIQTDAKFLALNQDSYGAIDAVRQNNVPFEAGNTNPKYWQAYHANIRKGALFSQGVSCIIDTFTNIKVLDVIKLKLVEMAMGEGYRKDPADESIGGNYIVTAKKKIIRGTRYAELFLLHRMTANLQGKAKLISSDTKGSAEPQPQDEEQSAKSDWTYVKEQRESNPKDNCFDIIKEEIMPTSKRSTQFDDDTDFSDSSAKNNGPYELALTNKTNTIQSRPYLCDPPEKNSNPG